MKKWSILFLLLQAVLVSVAAQSTASNDAERTRISSERDAAEAGFKQEELACYKKFFVSKCLDESQTKKNQALANLRRQEIAINDQERKAKGAKQLEMAEDKQSLGAQQKASEKRATAMTAADARAANTRDKAVNRALAATHEKSKLAEAAERANKAKDKQAARTLEQVAAGNRVVESQRRIAKAQERQNRLVKERAAQTKPTTLSLPIPQ